MSAVADPSTGVAVYGPHTQWRLRLARLRRHQRRGHRSWAASTANNGGTVTFGSDPYAHTADLNDVTTGNNGTCDAGKKAYFCNAEVGYDGPTGLGTPNGLGAFGN